MILYLPRESVTAALGTFNLAFFFNSNHNLTRTGGFSNTTDRGKTCSQHDINKRLGRHATHGASAFQAYLLPPHSGSSVCPRAARAA